MTPTPSPSKAASVSQGVADGWKLVPIEPTDDMDLAGAKEVDRTNPYDRDVAGNIWAAMISASPEAPSLSAAVPASGGVEAALSSADAVSCSARYLLNRGVSDLGIGEIDDFLRLASAIGVTAIKPLEWADGGTDSKSESAVGTYRILELSDSRFRIELNGVGVRNSARSLENAKATAQADYEQRIRSALSPAPTSGSEAGGEAVQQWRFRYRNSVPGEWRDWKEGSPVVPFSEWNPEIYEWETRTVYLAKPASEPADGAVRDVLAERRRQVEAEGWTPEHDDRHHGGEMARAAACYAAHASAFQRLPVKPEVYQAVDHYRMSVGWPWAAEWWKPKDPRRDLVRAGALILAEIERLDRAALSAPASSSPAEAEAREERADG